MLLHLCGLSSIVLLADEESAQIVSHSVSATHPLRLPDTIAVRAPPKVVKQRAFQLSLVSLLSH